MPSTPAWSSVTWRSACPDAGSSRSRAVVPCQRRSHPLRGGPARLCRCLAWHAGRPARACRVRGRCAMSEAGASDSAAVQGFSWRLALLLSMAMFVLVVDTSLMNVSISAVVRDLDATVSGVQSAIALEALVSASFILIGGKVGDLIGRKRAYILGLCGYGIGAVAMTMAQDLGAIILFWAVIGRIGASLLLPAMQSL